MSVATSLAENHPVETLYEFEESPLLARQSRQESNARSYPRRLPLALKRAKGLYVEDVEGRRFIDCLAGAGTLALGHNHPVVIAAIQQVLSDELPLHTLDLTTHNFTPRFVTSTANQKTSPSVAFSKREQELDLFE